MKNRFKKIAALVLSAIMIISSVCISSFAASPTEMTQLADKLFYYKNSFYSSNAQGDINENYFLYLPNSSVTPYLCYGNDVSGAASMSRVYRLENEAGNTLIASVNADYFTTSNGIPLGIEIKDGLIVSSSSSSFPEVGFTADGRAVIGRSGLNVSVQNITRSVSLPYANYNKALSDEGGLSIFSKEFGTANRAIKDKETINVLAAITAGSAKANSAIYATVKDVFTASDAQTLNEGELLLSVYTSSYKDTQSDLLSFCVGDQIRIDFSMDSAWNNITQAFGAKELLIDSAGVKSFSDNTRAPRTAIGTKADGSVVVYTCDGRGAGGSKGLSLTELARRMSQLGCTNAVNLDGGASTQAFVVFPGNTEAEQVNVDSGSSLRSCANYICFKNNLPATGKVAELYAYDNEITAIAGATKNLKIAARDENWRAVNINKADISYSLSDESLGSVSNSVFSAGMKKTDGTITAEYMGHSVLYNVHVLTEGRELEDFESCEQANTDLKYVHNGYKSLKLEPAEYYSLGTSFSGKYPSMISMWVYGNPAGLYIECDNRVYTVNEEANGWNRIIIPIDQNISALTSVGNNGEEAVYIDQLMAGFGTYIDDEAPEIKISINEPYLTAEIKDELDELINASDISVKLDGSSVEYTFNSSTGILSVLLPEADDKLHHVLITARDESGNIGRMSFALDRSELFSEQSGNAAEKKYIFSDLGASNWSTPYAEYLFNRGIISGYTSGERRYYKPSANMTRQEFAVVMAGWLGYDLSQFSDVQLDFKDNEKIASWSIDSVKLCVKLGIMGGKSIKGALYFDPQGNITREEVMTVIGRMLEKGYSSDDLSSFADSSKVSAYALPYVKALVGMKVISGSNGKLLPGSPVTREAVAKIIYELD